MAEVLRSAALAGVPHGFCTGAGLGPGTPEPPDPSLILPGAALVLVKQVHSALALAVDAPFASDALPEADALVTATPGLVLGIVTADCAPVLLADRAAGVVGAAHAGWRGALGGVLEASLAAMERLGAERARIVAAIGPCIAMASYEVDGAFRQRFGPGAERFFAPGAPGHWQFDLPGYVAHRLLLAGIGQVDDLALDTYTDPARFHSFRRATHRGEPTYGRQFSLVALPS